MDGLALLPRNMQLVRRPYPIRSRYAYLLFDRNERRFHNCDYPGHWASTLNLGVARPKVPACSWGFVAGVFRDETTPWQCHPIKYEMLHDDGWDPCSPLELLIRYGISIRPLIQQLQDYISETKIKDSDHEYFLKTTFGSKYTIAP